MKFLTHDDIKSNPTQNRIFETIKNKKENNIAIVGGPGTGKTVLLKATFDALKNPNNSQLHFKFRNNIFLTYSNPLANTISNSKDEVLTLHSFVGKFCYHWLSEGEHEDKINSEIYVVNLNIIWDKLIEDTKILIEINKDFYLYRSIFIDEGQDLDDKAYEFLQLISDRIVVAYDEVQQVGHENNNKKIIREQRFDSNKILNLLNCQENFFDLIDNYRNSQPIESVAKIFYNNYSSNNFSLLNINPNGKKGNKPKIIFNDFNEEFYDEIVNRGGRICLVVPNKTLFEQIKDGIDSKVQELNLKYGMDIKFFFKYNSSDNMKDNLDLNSNGIFLTTYKSSKGMEFEYVYIIYPELLDFNNDSDRNSLYVAITRAEYELNFILPNNSKLISTPFKNIIDASKDLFDFDDSSKEIKEEYNNDLAF